jgi:hypothetical protein
MNIKAASLAFIVVIATISGSAMLYFSSAQIMRKDSGFPKVSNTLKTDDNIRFELLGETINTPGMPG